ncbi:MAG: hypothetical protein K2Q23_13300, partial [Bryobacteraceae bacterium]|nr:hypothetical protein [Bryobacteraceae bacterium]
MTSTPHSRTPYFLIAAWAAIVFGLLEAIALQACRAFPALLAPYKSPVETLWIAPLLDLALFAMLALVLRVALSRWLGEARVHGVFFFLGVFTV